MLYLKREVLQQEEPLRYPGVGVCDQGEVLGHEVVAQFLDFLLYDQGFSFDGVVPPFSKGRLPYNTTNFSPERAQHLVSEAPVWMTKG